MNELALFAGAGGGILGGKLLGWRTRCAVEIDSYARRVLLARQRDGMLDRFPIWDDIKTFDGRPWRGSISVITGGFPCQDISAAGKGAGIEGERSGLWSEMARVINEVRPSYVFIENSPLLVGRGFAVVLRDLAQMGYDAKWGIVGAHHVAAPHKRNRIWIVADSQCERLERQSRHEQGGSQSKWDVAQTERPASSKGVFGGNMQWWTTEPGVGRVAHGVANRMDRLKAIGNGQVPAVAALAWQILTETK